MKNKLLESKRRNEKPTITSIFQHCFYQRSLRHHQALSLSLVHVSHFTVSLSPIQQVTGLILECPFQAINFVIRISVGLECDEVVQSNFQGCQDAHASPVTARDMQLKLNDWQGQVGTSCCQAILYGLSHYHKTMHIQQMDLIFHKMDYQ